MENAITSSTVQMQCESRKELNQYSERDKDGNLKSRYEISFHVPYGDGSIWYELSGGTTMVLRTINKAVADSFVIGKSYQFDISPAPEVTA